MQKYVNKNLFKKIFFIEIYAHNSRLKLLLCLKIFSKLVQKDKTLLFRVHSEEVKAYVYVFSV